MYGGTGDDTYTVGDATDFAYENADEGTDRVNASVDHQLRANVENLTLTGFALIGKGNELDNYITGSIEANKLYGYEGNDWLIGDAGDDYLLGGNGHDTMILGAGLDRAYGGVGHDTYIVSDSTDYAYENVGEGVDSVQSSVTHTLRANIEHLTLTGDAAINGTGNDLVNTIDGNEAANVLQGRGGGDRLNGLAGDDRLAGGEGDDLVHGGAGRDRLSGEAGADSFIFEDGDFAGMTSSTSDQIYDFSQLDGDKISLVEVDANEALADDQAFTFIGNGAFTGTAGELRYYQSNGQTYIQGDTNGDGDGDFLIRLDGLHNLMGSDFII
jgi:Ca2+-binding RTX toxin-like protein